jgi:mono/diheme cytochrome c family protein
LLRSRRSTQEAAQQQPAGRGGRGGGRGGAAAQAAPAAPAIPQISRRPTTDAQIVEQGKAIWSRECITCHGTNARGTDTGPNLIRSETLNYDRSKPAEGYGTVLGPFLKKGHPTQSGKASASFTDQEIQQLAQFLSEKISDTMRGSPTYIVLPENLLTGDAKAGEAFFKGEGTCVECHTSTTRSLAGIATRINNPQTLQAMVLYPATGGGRGGGGGGRGRGNAAPAGPLTPPAPNPLAITTTITPPGGKPITGIATDEDSFSITFWDSDGTLRTMAKTPGMKIEKNNPMKWHVEFSDRLTDKQMHDLTAYLWSLK